GRAQPDLLCAGDAVILYIIMADNETLECVTEHERILQEIESTDTACVGPTLR
ncbi:Exocyst complex component 6B, partial [Xenoophorus captivus]